MRRKKKRRQSNMERTAASHVGSCALLCWSVTLMTWGHTAWAIYSIVLRQVHVHLYGWIVALAVFFPILATVLTVEWLRARRKQ
ncbi:MAG TPA: hypothetical protein PLD59_09335 [Tepidisphaeraceae bacterium]|nr:hypothetical protein [Tepidisphaeraceae bacterium]